MRLEGIHHITAITGDAPRNVDFYTRVLGLRLVAKTVNQDDPTVYHLFYADEQGRPGAELTFFEYPRAVPGRAGAGMVHRIVSRVASDEALAFDQEHPEELWCGTRESLTIRRRDPATLSPAAARFASLPAGHPQGYADCFDSFVADVYAAVRGAELPEGTPTFSDGLRAAQITEAVLASSRDEQWVDVEPSRAVQAVAT